LLSSCSSTTEKVEKKEEKVDRYAFLRNDGKSQTADVRETV
jgi:hypothetical protein